jgi:DNA processing protein
MLSSREELLVINHIFYDSPKYAFTYLNTVTDDSASLEKIKQFIYQVPLKQDSINRLIKRLESINIDSIKQQLSDSDTQIITISDEIYPLILRELHFPPIVLYARGNVELLKSPLFGIVGSRKPTHYGLSTTKTFSKALSSYFSIVSGLAMGVDTIAHKEALLGTYSTIAILGSGFNRIYPASNKELFHTITKKGLVLTEFPTHVDSKPYHFPQRNRIITGLSRGVLIPEATLKSGSLVSANLAVEQNKDVFAIPGEINSTLSEGPIQLIKEGARCVTSPADILDEYGIESSPQLNLFSRPPQKETLNLNKQEKEVFTHITYDPITLESLCTKTNKPIHELLQFITLLEIKGAIKHINQTTVTRL